MYVVFIRDHIHHLMNESKIQSFAYNSDRRVYDLVVQIPRGGINVYFFS
jgi:hypothetical protein